MASGKIPVVLRIRPLSEKELNAHQNIVEIDSNQNILKIQDLEKSKEFKTYKFSKIYDDDSSTREIYEDVCSDIVKKIYMEHINDLIGRDKKRNLQINFNGQIPDLSEHKCTSYDDCLKLFNDGKKNRVQTATKLNEYSSRSHSIFSIKITNVEKLKNSSTKGFGLRDGFLNFVDLAGSESQKKADTSKRGFEEAIKINLSNFYLGQAILSLSKKIKPPYRSSKLTHVLQRALGGDGKTLFITNITPSSHLYSETLNSLKYADKAQKIEKLPVKINQNNVVENVIKQKNQEIQVLKKTIEDQEKEILRLKSENERLFMNSRNRMDERDDNEYVSTDSDNEKSEANVSNIQKRLSNLIRKLNLKKSLLIQKEEQKEDIINLIRKLVDETDKFSFVRDKEKSSDKLEILTENSENSFENDVVTNIGPMQQESKEENENEMLENYKNEISNLKSENKSMEKEIEELSITNKLKTKNELFLETQIQNLKTENEKLLKDLNVVKTKLFELYDEEKNLKSLDKDMFKKIGSELPKMSSKICSIL